MSVVEVNAPGLLDLVEADAELELIGSGFTFTEGPLWTNRDGGSLLFSDMPGDVRRRWSAAGGVEVVAQPSNKGNGLSWDLEGRLLICEHSTSSLISVEPDDSRTVLASYLPAFFVAIQHLIELCSGPQKPLHDLPVASAPHP